MWSGIVSAGASIAGILRFYEFTCYTPNKEKKMSYEFKTEILGLEMTVEGVFYAGEDATFDCPGEPPMFEVEAIYYEDEEIDTSELAYETWKRLEEEAFKKAHDDYDPY